MRKSLIAFALLSVALSSKTGTQEVSRTAVTDQESQLGRLVTLMIDVQIASDVPLISP